MATKKKPAKPSKKGKKTVVKVKPKVVSKTTPSEKIHLASFFQLTYDIHPGQGEINSTRLFFTSKDAHDAANKWLKDRENGRATMRAFARNGTLLRITEMKLLPAVLRETVQEEFQPGLYPQSK